MASRVRLAGVAAPVTTLPVPRQLPPLVASSLTSPSTCPSRCFSTTRCLRQAELRSIAQLPPRVSPRYLRHPKSGTSLLALKWPTPPRNLLIVQKLYAPDVVDNVVKFAKHVHSEYPDVHIVLEPKTAPTIQERLRFPVYASDEPSSIADKIDVIATFGGDGTVLRAASLFKLHGAVPPIVSFSMGTLGFLGEWNFEDYKKVWREVYMSGSDVAMRDAAVPRRWRGGGEEARGEEGGEEDRGSLAGWERMKGKSMGAQRASKVLLRHRIQADIFDASGANVNHAVSDTLATEARSIAGAKERSPPIRAINEISLHRGASPHMAVIDVYQNGHFVTETTADGLLISTPTGSTAYSLSAGGPIVHPLVKSLLITSISPCSLSFRSLVLPLDTKVTLRASRKNRGRELNLSIDGRHCGMVAAPGGEIRIEGEYVGSGGLGEEWFGGVPCIISAQDDDPWVGGLNGLLKFNQRFGRSEDTSDES